MTFTVKDPVVFISVYPSSLLHCKYQPLLPLRWTTAHTPEPGSVATPWASTSQIPDVPLLWANQCPRPQSLSLFMCTHTLDLCPWPLAAKSTVWSYTPEPPLLCTILCSRPWSCCHSTNVHTPVPASIASLETHDLSNGGNTATDHPMPLTPTC